MPGTNSDETLIALLELEAPDPAVEAGGAKAADGPQPGHLPAFDERVDMYLRAVHGADAPITAEMRAAARERLLAAMAEDIADQTIGPTAPMHADPIIPVTRSVAAQPAAPVSESLSQLVAILVHSLQQLLSAAVDAFTLPNLRIAAVPLVALFVVATVWTGNLIEDGGNVTDDNLGITRSLEPEPVDTVPEQNLKREIEADRKALGPAHLTLARKLVDLASLYRADGRYQDAEALCARALKIQQKALKPGDADLVRTLRELATVYRAQGRRREAEDLFTRADQP